MVEQACHHTAKFKYFQIKLYGYFYRQKLCLSFTDSGILQIYVREIQFNPIPGGGGA